MNEDQEQRDEENRRESYQAVELIIAWFVVAAIGAGIIIAMLIWKGFSDR